MALTGNRIKALVSALLLSAPGTSVADDCPAAATAFLELTGRPLSDESLARQFNCDGALGDSPAAVESNSAWFARVAEARPLDYSVVEGTINGIPFAMDDWRSADVPAARRFLNMLYPPPELDPIELDVGNNGCVGPFHGACTAAFARIADVATGRIDDARDDGSAVVRIDGEHGSIARELASDAVRGLLSVVDHTREAYCRGRSRQSRALARAGFAAYAALREADLRLAAMRRATVAAAAAVGFGGDVPVFAPPLDADAVASHGAAGVKVTFARTAAFGGVRGDPADPAAGGLTARAYSFARRTAPRGITAVTTTRLGAFHFFAPLVWANEGLLRSRSNTVRIDARCDVGRWRYVIPVAAVGRWAQAAYVVGVYYDAETWRDIEPAYTLTRNQWEKLLRFDRIVRVLYPVELERLRQSPVTQPRVSLPLGRRREWTTKHGALLLALREVDLEAQPLIDAMLQLSAARAIPDDLSWHSLEQLALTPAGSDLLCMWPPLERAAGIRAFTGERRPPPAAFCEEHTARNLNIAATPAPLRIIGFIARIGHAADGGAWTQRLRIMDPAGLWPFLWRGILQRIYTTDVGSERDRPENLAAELGNPELVESPFSRALLQDIGGPPGAKATGVWLHRKTAAADSEFFLEQWLIGARADPAKWPEQVVAGDMTWRRLRETEFDRLPLDDWTDAARAAADVAATVGFVIPRPDSGIGVVSDGGEHWVYLAEDRSGTVVAGLETARPDEVSRVLTITTICNAHCQGRAHP